MTEDAAIRRPCWVNITLLILAGIVFVILIALGNWQIQRLAWKTDLIQRVDARAFGAPVSLPPGPVTEDSHAYLRVEAFGAFDHNNAKRVKAVTELGPGHWLMVPLKMDGATLWVNRGFVPTGTEDAALFQPQDIQRVEGLLRLTKAGGTLLEDNDPTADRWVSRDVVRLSQAVGVSDALPYFVDAYHVGGPADWPRGGLTQVSFRNTHLSYALTWYAMALLFLGGMVYVVWDMRRSSKDATPSGSDG